MTDVHEPPGPDEQDAPARVTSDAVGVARALSVAATALSVPAFVVASAAGLGFLVLGIVVGTALADEPSLIAWVGLGLAVAGLAIASIFLLRVRATLRAGRDHAALAADLLGLVDIREITTATLADLAELTSRGAGLRAVSRGRALWRILRRMDVGEHTSRFERAKWFVPPEVAATWLLAQVLSWGGLVGWLLVPVAVAMRATGTL